MASIELMDCTLRDGGYVNKWDFTAEQIASTAAHLTRAGMNYVELGYITSILGAVRGATFDSVEAASKFIPADRGAAKYAVMADVSQFDADTLCPRSENTVDAIRVVFYKRQIEQAFAFCTKVVEKGYDLFLQPMVTVDYSAEEFEELVKRFDDMHHPYAVAVVDSFGCMTPQELREFVEVLDTHLSPDVKIGFHGHENLRLSHVNAETLFQLETERDFIIDATVNGMGRGAGNLCTELIANWINLTAGARYDLTPILAVMSDVTEPISRTQKWGYSPYFVLTALRKAHPNFATYLLANHDVNVAEFREFLELIPDEMLTRCTQPYVEELYGQLQAAKGH